MLVFLFASLAIGIPVVVGVLLGAEAAAGLLMAGTITGVLVGLMMNNGGGGAGKLPVVFVRVV